jgi:hypothetical protein
MNNIEVWKYLQQHAESLLHSTVHIELKFHTDKNLDYYYAPKLNKEEKHKIIYLDNNFLIIVEFDLEYFLTKYIKLKNIISLHKDSDIRLLINYNDLTVETLSIILDTFLYRKEAYKLFDSLIEKI